MAQKGFQSESQKRYLTAKRPDVATAWAAGRTLSGQSFTPKTTLPIHKSGVKRQKSKRRRGRI